MIKKRIKAKIVMEDGRSFGGLSFGAEGESTGEIVFNTSMTGYQEILTDPSYKGQAVVMTCPLIGNYGINEEDAESGDIFVEGLIVRECSRIASNWRSQLSLDEYLKKYGILGIEDVDTRAITRHIRQAGAMRGVLSTGDLDVDRLVKKARESAGLVGRDLVKKVTSKNSQYWKKEGRYNIVVIDCGVKYNILRMLGELNCKVTTVPASVDAEAILAMKPDGLLMSNGPGDPAGVPYLVETLKKLIGRFPIFGICLGHQILGLALGGKTYKLKFGHHGANHPVRDLNTGKIAITVQNHGFCVDAESLDNNIEVTHINLNDNTLEGMRHLDLPLFSVQFHPEASPGPHDAGSLFNDFINMVTKNNA